jgi:hypothetical protein
MLHSDVSSYLYGPLLVYSNNIFSACVSHALGNTLDALPFGICDNYVHEHSASRAAVSEHTISGTHDTNNLRYRADPRLNNKPVPQPNQM